MFKFIRKSFHKSGVVIVAILFLSAVAPSFALAATPEQFGLKDGDVISATGDPDVYIVNEYGYKRLFVNPQIFNLYGQLGWDKVKHITPAIRDSFITSGLFRNCESNDPKVYGLDVVSEDIANLRWVNTSGAQAVADDPNFFKKVFCINNRETALYGQGTAYTSVLDVPKYGRAVQAASVLSNADIIKKVKPSVAFIQTVTEAGSGFTIDSNGYVLTNAHVVAGYDVATVKLSDGRTYQGKVVGRNENVDLAIIKISTQNLTIAELGNSDSLQQGDSVYALGYPFGLSGDVSFTEGTLSRRLDTSGSTYLETTAEIHPGNSGGPLVNSQGQVIGINTQVFGNSVGGTIVGETIKLAIPINTAKSYISLLEAGQNVLAKPSSSQIVTPTPIPGLAPTPTTAPPISALSTGEDFSQYQHITLNKYTNNPSAYIGQRIYISNAIAQFLPKGGNGGSTNYVKLEDPISHVDAMIVFNNSSDYAAVANTFTVGGSGGIIKVYGIGSSSVKFTQGGGTVSIPVVDPRRIDYCPNGGGGDNFGPDPTDPWEYGCYGETRQLLPYVAPTPTPISTPTSTPTSPSTAGTAYFIRIDLDTNGTWKNTYGSQGYNIALDASNIPSYAQVSFTGKSDYTWFASTNDLRGLQKANSQTDRLMAAWYAGTFSINVNISDGRAHQIALYMLDGDNGNRSQTVQVLDTATGTVLDSKSISTFYRTGAYVVWNIKDNVTFKIMSDSGPNAVISGLFFDPSWYQL